MDGKNKLIVPFIFILFYACASDTKEKTPNSSQAISCLRIDHKTGKIDTVQYEVKEENINAGTKHIVYKNTAHPETTTEYFLSADTAQSSLTVANQKDTSKLKLIRDKVFAVGADNIFIYKFIKNYGTVDGESTLFWCPNNGIVIEYSNTWKYFTKMIGNNARLSLVEDIIISDLSFYSIEKPIEKINFTVPQAE